MSAAIGIPTFDRRRCPLIDHALEFGEAEAAKLDRRAGLRHAALLSLRMKRSNGRSMSKGRTAIVTGAGKRVGAAIGSALLEDGWRVVAHVHHQVDEVCAGATKVVADLARPDCAEMIFEAASGLPPVRLLVNNAARFAHDEFSEFSTEEFAAHMA